MSEDTATQEQSQSSSDQTRTETSQQVNGRDRSPLSQQLRSRGGQENEGSDKSADRSNAGDSKAAGADDKDSSKEQQSKESSPADDKDTGKDKDTANDKSSKEGFESSSLFKDSGVDTPEGFEEKQAANLPIAAHDTRMVVTPDGKERPYNEVAQAYQDSIQFRKAGGDMNDFLEAMKKSFSEIPDLPKEVYDLADEGDPAANKQVRAHQKQAQDLQGLVENFKQHLGTFMQARKDHDKLQEARQMETSYNKLVDEIKELGDKNTMLATLENVFSVGRTIGGLTDEEIAADVKMSNGKFKIYMAAFNYWRQQQVPQQITETVGKSSESEKPTKVDNSSSEKKPSIAEQLRARGNQSNQSLENY